MGKQVTLGGDRLGAGKRQKVELHGYERSTHNMGYIWRSTMAAGTLVPFLSEVALPGDTFDINLDCDIKTHPTIGPLFGSYKVQLDLFQAPIRLYQGQLHNNKLGIGMKMSQVKLPLIRLEALPVDFADLGEDIDNLQINPSALLSYLGIRGVGLVSNTQSTDPITRDFNAVPLLAYWEIYKNYYANKQEQYGAMVYTEPKALLTNLTALSINGTNIFAGGIQVEVTDFVEVIVTASTVGVLPWMITLNFQDGSKQTLESVVRFIGDTLGFNPYSGTWAWNLTGNTTVVGWEYTDVNSMYGRKNGIANFQLKWIDDMREKILAYAVEGSDPFIVNTHVTATDPYYNILTWGVESSPYLASQQGLALKTYQSDLFNNWLDTEWIDGVGGINDITAISTVGGSFTIDTLQLSKKVYDMLNRIAVSGGSYDDWLDAVYTHDRIQRAESPIYHGGLIKELVFDELVSMAENAPQQGAAQPLGTLAGRGVLARKHKGGQIRISVDEPSYIMGIISLTPRIDYSQGNKWDIHLQTMDDLHKPALDAIGFQELITEQMAWFDTNWNSTTFWTTRSAGKQPAWINYMTNVNQVRGNFAIQSNEMFMTLNRRYEYSGGGSIADVTTYIDPHKYNWVFAYTAIDAQNFWAQIAIDMEVRRKMSAKVMPNL
jgi:hypothetical protein